MAALAAAGALTACAAPPSRDSLVGDYLTGSLAARLNEVDEAAEFFARAQAEAPQSNEILKDAFFFQLAAGNFEEAVGFARTIVAREEAGGGDDGLARIVLAAEALRGSSYRRARSYLSENIQSTYFLPLRTLLNAWAIAGLEGPDAALLKLTETDKSEFKGFQPLHQALLAEKAGRTDETLAAHQLSVMTFGGPVGREAYGAYLERSGAVDTAREFYELLYQDPGPDHRIAEAGLARLDRGEATNRFENVSPAGGAAIAFYTLGAAFLERAVNQRTAAEEAGFRIRDENYNIPLIFTQLALYLDPSLDVARRFSGSIMRVYGDHEKAIATLSVVPAVSPYYEAAQIEIAGALIALERDGGAIGLLRALASADREAREARMSLAGIFSRLGRHDDALSVLDEVIAGLPAEPGADAWRYFVARGAAHLEADDWARAEKDLKRAVETAPEEPTALNYLGYSWAERGENLEEAFKLIEKAVALRPTSGAIIDSLGWAYYQLGNYEEAVGHLEKAATLEPADPTITDHLGDVYWRLGRKTEARYQWRHALELEPDENLEASLERKLEEGLSDKAP